MNKLLNLGYASIHWTYWMSYGVICSFASVFLLAKGYTNWELGLILATGNVVAVLFQPIVADFADRSKKLSLMGISQIMAIILMVFMFLLMVYKHRSVALSVVFVMAIAWHTAIQPLYNTLAFKLEEAGVHINFGAARSMGSLGYSILCAVFGTLIETYGVDIMPVTAEVTLVMLLLCVAVTNSNFKRAQKLSISSEPTEEKNRVSEKKDINLLEFIRRNKLFLLVNIGVLGVFFSNSVLNSFMMQIVTNVGGTSEDLGRILSVMAFLEIPTMFCFDWFRKKFGSITILKVSSIFFTIKIAACMIAKSVVMIYGAMLFQLLSFALFLPAMVSYIDEIMDEGESVKGQALYTTTITVTTVIANLAGGFILDVSGAPMLTKVSTAATLLGTIIIIAAVDKVKTKNNKINKEYK